MKIISNFSIFIYIIKIIRKSAFILIICKKTYINIRIIIKNSISYIIKIRKKIYNFITFNINTNKNTFIIINILLFLS